MSVSTYPFQKRTVDGLFVEVTITHFSGHDQPLFDVYMGTADYRTLLTHESLDDVPTDDEIRELIQQHRQEVTE